MFKDFASKKDRRGLLVYKTVLQKQSECYYYADQILKSPVRNYHFILLVNKYSCSIHKLDYRIYLF